MSNFGGPGNFHHSNNCLACILIALDSQSHFTFFYCNNQEFLFSNIQWRVEYFGELPNRPDPPDIQPLEIELDMNCEIPSTEKKQESYQIHKGRKMLLVLNVSWQKLSRPMLTPQLNYYTKCSTEFAKRQGEGLCNPSLLIEVKKKSSQELY